MKEIENSTIVKGLELFNQYLNLNETYVFKKLLNSRFY